jgi:hypothetical protein
VIFKHFIGVSKTLDLKTVLFICEKDLRQPEKEKKKINNNANTQIGHGALD